MRDEFNRCAVCGRRPSEPCCTQCHAAHDHIREHPVWALLGSGNVILPAHPRSTP